VNGESDQNQIKRNDGEEISGRTEKQRIKSDKGKDHNNNK